MAELAFPDKTWDLFFEFLTPDVDEMTDEQIRAELDELGIDIEPAIDRVRSALKARSSREAERVLKELDNDRR